MKRIHGLTQRWIRQFAHVFYWFTHVSHARHELALPPSQNKLHVLACLPLLEILLHHNTIDVNFADRNRIDHKPAQILP